ncbi:hypothetical protein AKO1_005206, partial [Acrasis kona]
VKWMDESFTQSNNLPNPDTNSLRYGFDGKPIQPGSDHPSHSALYHHGVEPDQPGYTLTEIGQLMRSTVPGQRAINMDLLNNICRRTIEQFGRSSFTNEFLPKHLMS